jgi:hypothetical protein
VLQVGRHSLQSLTSQDVHTCFMKATSSFSTCNYSTSVQDSFALSPYSKLYLMFSTTDTASAAIDFRKGNVDNGMVDSPPNQSQVATSIFSPSLLKLSRATPIWSRSCSLGPRTKVTPHRQLYKELPCLPSKMSENQPCLISSTLQTRLQFTRHHNYMARLNVYA